MNYDTNRTLLPYYLASVCAVSFCIEYDAPNSTRVSFKKGCWLHVCTCVQQTNGSLPSQRPFLLRIHSHRFFSAATTFSALHTCAEIFQWISNFVSFCQEEDFWLMRVTFSSTCHLQLMRLNHHPPLVERWGRNKKWHKPFFGILLLPSPSPCPPAGRHKTTWRQNSAIRFKPLREMRCNC